MTEKSETESKIEIELSRYALNVERKRNLGKYAPPEDDGKNWRNQ